LADTAEIIPSATLIVGCSSRKAFMFYSEIIASIERLLSKKDYNCIFHMHNGDYDHFVNLINKLQHTESSATLMLGDFSLKELTSLLEIVPDAILLDNPGYHEIAVPYESISFDNAEAARIGVLHLQERGCRKIALLSGPRGHYFSEDIKTGYEDIIKPSNSRQFFNSDFTQEGAYRTIFTALRKKIKFDGIFTNDEMAIGVYKALNEAGLRIPEDVAVCGCDNIPMSEYLSPPLTTVKLDYTKMAEAAVASLFSENRHIYSGTKIKLNTSIEIRKST